MTAIVFYEKPGCATNARQKDLLRRAGHTVEARDLLAVPWTAEDLRRFFGTLPVAQWFNRNAPRVKSGEIAPDALDADSALALMLADPLLIRRPLLQAGGQRCTGFDPAAIDRWLGLGSTRVPEGLEVCHAGAGDSPCPAPERQR